MSDKTALDLMSAPWKDLLEKERQLLDLERTAAVSLLREDLDKARSYQSRRDQQQHGSGGVEPPAKAKEGAKKWFDAEMDTLDQQRQTLETELAQRRKERQQQKDLVSKWEADLDELLTELGTVAEAKKTAAKRTADLTADREQARAEGRDARVAKLDAEMAVAKATEEHVRTPEQIGQQLDAALKGWQAARATLGKIVASPPGTTEDKAHRTIETLEIELKKIAKQVDYLRAREAEIVANHLGAGRPAAPPARP